MKLKTFLTLTGDDKNICNSLITPQLDENTLFNIVTNSNIIQLIKIASIDPQIDSLLKEKIFDLHWFGIWQECRNENEFKLKELNTIHSFDLIKGNYFFWKYLELKQDNLTDAREYLEKSAEYGLFPACNSLLKYYFGDLKNNKESHSSLINKIIHISDLIAKINWTPGYIIACLTYFSLAVQVKKNLHEGLSKKFFCKALYSIDLAEALTEYSTPMIHNASQGRGLDYIISQINFSFPNMRNRICKIAGPLLTNTDINNCLEKSSNKFNVMVNLYNLTTEFCPLELSSPSGTCG